MKRFISMLVVVSIIALSAVSAFAAEVQNITPVEGRYSLTVEGLDTGSMYGMVAIKGADASASQISEASIVYIDQATAEDGKITFTAFGLMNNDPDAEGFVETSVFIGGGTLGTAQKVAVLKAAEVEVPSDSDVPSDSSDKVTVSGKVTDVSYATPVQVTAIDKNGETIATAETDENGDYSFEVDKNVAFDLSFSKKYYCTFTYTDISVADAATVATVDMTKYAGDVNETSEVNAYDLGELLADFNKTVAAGTLEKGDPSDINTTDEVNAYDLGILLAAFNAKSASSAYTE